MIYDFPPKRSLGQNFLVNRGIVQKIIDVLNLTEKDTVLEIGPGTGILTKYLDEKSSHLILVEKDHRLISPLENAYPKAEVVEGDVLEFNPEGYNLKPGNYKIVGNIPYYLTSHLIRTIFEKWPIPQLIVLMVQKEVAQRIMAAPPHMNLLALSVQFFSTPEIIANVSRGSFRPMPNVDSAVIKIVPKKTNLSTPDQKELFNIIKAGFSSKRKQLAGNLAAHLSLDKSKVQEILKNLNISDNIRAENLSLKDWQQLASKDWFQFQKYSRNKET